VRKHHNTKLAVTSDATLYDIKIILSRIAPRKNDVSLYLIYLLVTLVYIVIIYLIY